MRKAMKKQNKATVARKAKTKTKQPSITTAAKQPSITTAAKQALEAIQILHNMLPVHSAGQPEPLVSCFQELGHSCLKLLHRLQGYDAGKHVKLADPQLAVSKITSGPQTMAERLFLHSAPALLHNVMLWLDCSGLAGLQAACREVGQSWAFQARIDSAILEVAPGGGLVRPSQLSWVALLEHAESLAISWGSPGAVKKKLAAAVRDSPFTEPLTELVSGERPWSNQPTTILLTATVVAAMRKHSGDQALQIVCSNALADIALTNPEVSDIASVSGAPRLLVALLSRAEAPAQRASARALSEMTNGKTFARAACRAGLIPQVVNRMQSGDRTTREDSFTTLMHVIRGIPENAVDARLAGAIPRVLSMLQSRGDKECKATCFWILMFMTEKDPQACVDLRTAGALRHLLALLRMREADFADPGDLCRAAEVLTEVLCKDPESRTAVRLADGIPTLIKLLQHVDSEAENDKEKHVTRGCAADALSCLAIDRAGAEIILSSDGVRKLVKLLQSPNDYARNAAVAALCVLVKVDSRNAAHIRRAKGIPLILPLTKTIDGSETSMTLGMHLPELLGTQHADTKSLSAILLEEMTAVDPDSLSAISLGASSVQASCGLKRL